MITIVYTEHGDSNADLKSESLAMWIYENYKDNDYIYLTSTETLILAFRLLVAEGKIPHDKIVFRFNGEIIKILPDGQTHIGYPKGFCDAETNILFRMMEAKRKR